MKAKISAFASRNCVTFYEFCNIIQIILLLYGPNFLSPVSSEVTTLHRELVYSINEESEIGSYVGNLKQDSERTFLIPASQLSTFELYDDSKQNYFQVESASGRLLVNSRIDREAICAQPSSSDDASLSHPPNIEIETNLIVPEEKDCQIHLSLLAAQTYWINVIVTVNDINDNYPQFPNELQKSLYVINVAETVSPGYEVPLLGARDLDIGINSVQTYSLRGAELDPSQFSINYQTPFTLNLVILGEMDAEKRVNYTGELVACDGGQPVPKCAAQPLRVHLLDQNDNKPTFDRPMYEVEINENLPVNSTVIQLNATDADSGVHGKIRYRLGQHVSAVIMKMFGIQPSTGILYTKGELNARLQSSYVISVLAEDGGAVPLIGQTVVRITVHDVNDHSPWIEVHPDTSSNRDTSHMVLEENRPVGTSIGLLVSGDEDLGKNSKVVCKLDDQLNTVDFYLEHVNSVKGREMYQIKTNKSFDREALTNSQGIIAVTVICSDSGLPQLSTKREVPVHILDVNEFRPTFPSDGQVSTVHIEEGRPTGTFVHQVQASDADATPKVNYYLSREAQAYFHIDPNSGVITTRDMLDRESMPSIRFNIFVTDNDKEELEQHKVNHGVQAAVTNLTVYISDINDNAPELVEKQSFQIMENRPGFSDLVGQLAGIDHDAGNNGTVGYHLVSVKSFGVPILNDTFTVDVESGKIFTLRSLDREQHSQYELTVLLQDMGTPVPQNTTAVITVEVLDENDNKPTWREPTRTLPQARFSSNQDGFQHRSRLPGYQHVEELGQLNLTVPLFHGQHVILLQANDADTGSNANLTFSLLAAYIFGEQSVHSEEVDSQYASSSTVPPTKSTLFTVAKSTGDLLVGPGNKGRGLTSVGLVELYLRVSDNGHPPLDSVGRLFVNLLPSVNHLDMAGVSSGGGLFPLLISKGHMGLVLIILLITITCLACCCLICALISFKRKSDGGSCCCRGPPGTNRNHPTKSNHLQLMTGIPSGQLHITAPLSVEEMFHLGKQWQPVHKTSGSLFTENASLCQWTPECTVTMPMGNFASPPLHNGLHTNCVEDGKGGIALLPLEVPCCPDNLLLDDIIFTNDRSPLSPTHTSAPGQRGITADCHQMTSGMLVSSGLQASTTTSVSVSSQRMPKSCNEVDGGSADSGRGASEDEPANPEAWRKYLNKDPNNSHSIAISKSHQLPLPELRLLNGTTSTTGAGTPKHMATFGSSFQPREFRLPSTSIAEDPPLPPPPHRPSLDECYNLPRWHEPLFSNGGHLGHHNHLFEEFPTASTPSKISRQSATLPLATRMSSPPRSRCSETNNGKIGESHHGEETVGLDRSTKVATLSHIQAKKNWIR